jgi:pilus assembly protein FimV
MAVKREKVVQTAERYVQRGKIDAAIREYRKVLAEQPDDATTLNRVGDLYARSDRIPEAVQLFTQIAENYTADGFFPKATAIYKKIIKLDPTRLGVYEQLASLYHRQGLLNEARTQYQVLADYYLKHDNATSATAIYERMTEVDPDDPSLRVRLAELYRRQKLLDKAMGQYRRIAETMLDHGHGGEAEQVLLKALEVDASDVGFITDGVVKLKEAGHVAAAARFLATAVQRNPEASRVADVVDVPAPEELETAEAAEAAEAAAEVAAPEAAEPEAREAPAELLPSIDEDEAATDPVLQVEAAPETLVEEPETFRAEDGPAAFTERGFPGDDFTSTGEITLDLDGAFDLDLEDDEAPASQVQPPPDMLEDEPPAAASSAAVAGPAAAEPPAAPAAPEPPPAAPSLADEGIDADFLERTAAELHPEQIRQEEDLVTEAEVLAKYGLTEKAMERLGELLVLNPQHPGGLSLLIRLHLDEGKYEGAAELATELLRAAPRSEAWTETWERLERSGFVATEAGVVLPPGTEEEEADTAPGLDLRVEEAVEEPAFEVTATTEPAFDLAPELGEEAPAAAIVDEPVFEPLPELGEGEPEAPPAAPGQPAAADAAAEIDAALSALGPAEPAAGPPAAPASEAPEEEVAAPPRPAAAPPPQAAGKPARRGRTDVEGLLASLAADLLPHRRRKAAAPPPAAGEPAAAAEAGAPPAAAAPPRPPPAEPPQAAAPPPPADASPAWLEQTVSGEAPPAEEGMFSDEEDFFDLAAELEEELSREGALEEGDDLLLEQPREQSLEEIVEGFKKGVAENLSAEDHSTHFDLGIAYREMGLLDEAIGEFQVAAKSPELLVECCSMLGLCFLQKGLPELAVKWYRRGLDAPGLGEDEQLGLLYELGNAQMAAGERTEAHRTFLDLYGTNSNYRDVVAKVEETRKR